MKVIGKIGISFLTGGLLTLSGCVYPHQTPGQANQTSDAQFDPYTHSKYIHGPKFNLEWPGGNGDCFLSVTAFEDGPSYCLYLFAKGL